MSTENGGSMQQRVASAQFQCPQCNSPLPVPQEVLERLEKKQALRAKCTKCTARIQLKLGSEGQILPKLVGGELHESVTFGRKGATASSKPAQGDGAEPDAVLHSATADDDDSVIAIETNDATTDPLDAVAAELRQDKAREDQKAILAMLSSFKRSLDRRFDQIEKDVRQTTQAVQNAEKAIKGGSEDANSKHSDGRAEEFAARMNEFDTRFQQLDERIQDLCKQVASLAEPIPQAIDSAEKIQTQLPGDVLNAVFAPAAIRVFLEEYHQTQAEIVSSKEVCTLVERLPDLFDFVEVQLNTWKRQPRDGVPENERTAVIKVLEAVQASIEDWQKRTGFRRFAEVNDEYVPERHKLFGEELTDDPDLIGRIQEVVRTGYEFADHEFALRRAWVKVWAASREDNAES